MMIILTDLNYKREIRVGIDILKASDLIVLILSTAFLSPLFSLLIEWLHLLCERSTYFKDILIEILFSIQVDRGWPAPVDWDVACAASCIDGASGSRNYHPSRGTCNARHVP